MPAHLLERHGVLGVEPLAAREDRRDGPRRVKDLDLVQVPRGSETTAVAGDLRAGHEEHLLVQLARFPQEGFISH